MSHRNPAPGFTVKLAPPTGRWGVYCTQRGRVGSASTRAQAIALSHEIAAERARMRAKRGA